jgi:DNA processing protein
MATAIPRLSREEELHWLALRLVPGLGARQAFKLVEVYRSAQAIFRAGRTELRGVGLSEGVAASITSGCTFDDAVQQQELALQQGVAILPLTSPAYPSLLKEIYDPPPVLFVRGDAELLARPMVAIVGSRRATPYGLAAAERLATDLSTAGLVIVSGMARGIDTAGHRGALAAGAPTVAVFGCGVDIIYPTENRKLAEEIAANGALVSEFPLGSPAFPQNFPIRNRIVSGMAQGVLVVEGSEYSGSAITARLAADQGREVFAIPGNITSKMSWGPNLLIKQGAHLTQDWNDVVVNLNPEVRRQLAARMRQSLAEAEPELAPVLAGPNAEIARELLSLLTFDEKTLLDTLLEKLPGRSSSEIIAALFELELSGMVRQLPGKNFVKVWYE